LFAHLHARYVAVQKVAAYVRARLAEKSTLAGLSAAVAAGAVVPSPYSYVIIFMGIVAVFIPEPKK
jgi:hypothetical protein